MAKREHSYNSGRIYRAGNTQNRAPGNNNTYANPRGRGSAPAPRGGSAQAVAARPAARRGRGGASRKKKVLITLIVVLLVLAAAGGVFAYYLGNVFETGEIGAITDKKNVEKNYAKKKDAYNFLLVGIDTDEERKDNLYVGDLGMTDVILYVNMDVKNGKLNILQIPRDSYPGEAVDTGSSGKINAVLKCGPDQEAPINNLVDVVEQQFKLPVDNYISIDMDGFKGLVDALNGLDVFVPYELDFDGSHIPQGWNHLDGAGAEFFVRNRHGEGFERGDPDRLNNQRYFYAALFRRLMALSAGDVPGMLGVFDEYCRTDYSAGDLLNLALSVKGVGSENIIFCQVPGATSAAGWSADPAGYDRSVYFIDLYGRQVYEQPDASDPNDDGMRTDPENPGLANLLNEYFRAQGSAVSADELGPPDLAEDKRYIPEGVSLYPPNVQVMSEVNEAGADQQAA